MTTSRLLLLAAVVVFVLAAFGVTVNRFDVLDEVAIGLALCAGASLV